MRKKLIPALVWLLLCTAPACFAKGDVEAKEHYNAAWQEIKDMLEGRQPLSYERAVFLVENAWYDNTLSYKGFREMMDEGEAAIRSVMAQSSYSTPNAKPDDFFGELQRKGSLNEEKISTLLANRAIFSYMADTLFMADRLSGNIWLKLPFQYASSDPMGTADWTNTQVGNLLVNGEGNCYAFASLFRIFAERLQSGANIATAPGHVYIVHPDGQGNKHNVELASRSFPGTGTLATLTHTTIDALRNNLALRELDLRQSVALCLVYLAKGYEHRTQTKDNGFSLACAELALAHDNMSLNAMLLKAEVLEREITITGGKSVTALRSNPAFGELEQMLDKLYGMGYLEMPLEMKNTLVMGWTKDTAAQRAYPLPPATDADSDTHTRMASLSWGLFEEEIKAKPIERYGNTLFDTQKRKITGFAAQQALYNDYNFDPVVFAWNIDPLFKKFPDVTPYGFANNSPILFVDTDGRETRAYDKPSQDLVLGTLKYAFGKNHGFKFENNKLIHNGEVPKKMTTQQQLLFNYINKTLVESFTVTEVYANKNQILLMDGGILRNDYIPDGGAMTYGFPAETRTLETSALIPSAPFVTAPARNKILITSGLMSNGIELMTTKGFKKFSKEHAAFHEMGHSVLNVILSEFNGQFDGINFNKMSDEEISEWAIRFTNTLLESNNAALETGHGQHGRSPDNAPPPSQVAPLNSSNETK